MISKAITRYIRMSPRKPRLVADMVRGKSINEALAILSNVHKKAAMYISDIVVAAVANAKINPEIAESDLYISKLVIDGGPMFKRYKSGSMGRASTIRKRTSHLTVELDQRKPEGHEHKPKEHVAHEQRPKKVEDVKEKVKSKKVKVQGVEKRGK